MCNFGDLRLFCTSAHRKYLELFFCDLFLSANNERRMEDKPRGGGSETSKAHGSIFSQILETDKRLLKARAVSNPPELIAVSQLPLVRSQAENRLSLLKLHLVRMIFWRCYYAGLAATLSVFYFIPGKFVMDNRYCKV